MLPVSHGFGFRAIVFFAAWGAAVALARADEGDPASELEAAFRKGLALRDMGRNDEALPYFDRALKLAPQVYGPKDARTAILANELANIYFDAQDYAKAEPLYERTLTIREAALGQDHATVADSLNNLARLYVEVGKYAKAEPLRQRSLAIREARHDHLGVANSLNELGNLYIYLARYEESEALHLRSLQIREKRLGPNHSDVAASLYNLGLIYETLGQYAKAEPLHVRSIEIKERNLGEGHPYVALGVSGLGTLYLRMGQYAKAEPLYQRSLKTYLRLKNDLGAANQLNNLGLVYAAQRRYADAERSFQSALERYEPRLGKDHPDVARTLHNLADVQRGLRQYDQAETLYRRSIEIKEKALGKDHPYVASALNDLGRLYSEMGKRAEAEALYRRSLSIQETRLGKNHPDVQGTLLNLVRLYSEQEQWEQAAQSCDRSRRIIRRHLRKVLPALPESEQLAYLLQDEAGSQTALSLAWWRRDDAKLVAMSASWLLNSKGVAHQILAERALLARADSDPEQAKLAAELIAVRRQLAAWTYRIADTNQGAEERARQLGQLTVQEQQLSGKLAQRLGGVAGASLAQADPWVELSDVQKALPADAVLIDINRFMLSNFKTRSLEGDRYAAWVIFPGDEAKVRLIDLGAAAPIERAVEAVRRSLHEAPKTIAEKGELESEQALRQLSQTVAKLILNPLLSHVGDRKNWIISGDGSLWLVPWAALPLAGGRYVIEDHSIRHVISGRDLVTGDTTKFEPNPPVVMADPNFDLGLAEAAAETRRVLQRDTGALALRAPAASLGKVRWSRLPGTATEAEAIRPNLEKYGGKKPYVYTENFALEGVLKAFAKPRVAVLCTHGFFLEDQEMGTAGRAISSTDEKQPTLTRDGKLLENPLLRCGLVLAGANHKTADVSVEDGVLTGLEIVGLDLRGCELVVLSACETGLGEVRNGEGVAGLRQAFQLAGAGSVVATLWQIPDRDSALLMSDFFDQLAKGRGKAEALREAQLARIKAHRDGNGAAHPFFWAAFTLTGQDQPSR